jgi:hypothetical protein
MMLLETGCVLGQISPPGMDDTNAVSWGAVGMNQQISKRWSTTMYVGYARESNPDNFSLLTKSAIFVANQETQYLFNTKWQLAFCSSFRIQNRYIKEAPYTSNEPSLRDELRFYSRLYYRNHIGKINITYSFRPELRLFYDQHLTRWDSSPEELRFRFKIQANIPLNEEKSNLFIVGNEWLSATDKKSNPDGMIYWSSYRFTEDRFTTYLRHILKKPALIIDVGMMHQIRIDDHKAKYIVHFGFDFLFQNPFGTPAISKK